MTTTFQHLSAPLTLRGHTIPNRVMMGSMHLGLEEAPGGFERMAEFYTERVRGGTHLIVTGGISPNEEGALGPGGATMRTEHDVAQHRLVTDAVHEAGGVILLQLLHAGRYATHPGLVAPSAIQAPINRFAPRVLTGADISRTIDDYAHATRLARDAGYDGVEVMGSEGYLINSFLSPVTNQRDDEWGGDADRRRSFALAVTRSVREALGDDGILSYRISMADLIPGSSTLDDALEQGRVLELLGVDLFVTGIGWHESRIPTIATSVPRAAFIDFTAALRETVEVPVAATNRINTPEVAEAILAEGKADLVALARPLLADSAFTNKAIAGFSKQINTCIGCNQACLDHVLAGKLTTCLVNPRAGRETELVLAPTRTRIRVAVVGAGVAGLAAAVSAAERGCEVTVFEKRHDIGGQFDMAMRIPGKEEFTETLRFYRGEIERFGVTLRLTSRANLDDLEGFDEIIVATGVMPRIPDILGITDPIVATYAEILRGERVAGERVVILGAGGIGFDTAQFLTHGEDRTSLDRRLFLESWGVAAGDPSAQGSVTRPRLEASPRHVTMLQRKTTKAGAGLGLTTGWIHRAEVARRGVETVLGVSYDRITTEGVHVTVGGEAQFFPADTVVLCTGQESVSTLYAELETAGRSAHLIGGAKLAGELDAKRAIREGTEIAAAL